MSRFIQEIKEPIIKDFERKIKYYERQMDNFSENTLIYQVMKEEKNELKIFKNIIENATVNPTEEELKTIIG